MQGNNKLQQSTCVLQSSAAWSRDDKADVRRAYLQWPQKPCNCDEDKMCRQNQGVLINKGLYDVQHWGEVEVIGLCMIDFVKNLHSNPCMSESYSTTLCCVDQQLI